MLFLQTVAVANHTPGFRSEKRLFKSVVAEIAKIYLFFQMPKASRVVLKSFESIRLNFDNFLVSLLSLLVPWHFEVALSDIWQNPSCLILLLRKLSIDLDALLAFIEALLLECMSEDFEQSHEVWNFNWLSRVWKTLKRNHLSALWNKVWLQIHLGCSFSAILSFSFVRWRWIRGVWHVAFVSFFTCEASWITTCFEAWNLWTPHTRHIRTDRGILNVVIRILTGHIRHRKSLVVKVGRWNCKWLDDWISYTVGWINERVQSTYLLAFFEWELRVHSQILLGASDLVDSAHVVDLGRRILTGSLRLNYSYIACGCDVLPTGLSSRSFEFTLERIVIIDILVGNVKLLDCLLGT